MLTHTGTQTIETERLILRRFEYSDCGSVFANWASDEEEDCCRWAVIERKCGLTCEGTLRDYFYMDGKYVGRLYFSILRDEYENKEVKYD